MNHSIIQNSRFKKVATEFLVAAFWLIIWQFIYLKVNKDILVVSPIDAFLRLLELAITKNFWSKLAFTCFRVILGFMLSLIAGSILAGLSVKFKLVHALFKPLLEIINATPIASFIILALIWISSGKLPIFIAFLMVVPVVWSNLYEGIKSADSNLLEMASIFQFTALKKIRLIYIPAIMPYFIAACSTGIGFAWKSAISAEVIAHPHHSIGGQIYDAKIYLETVDLFAWTITVIILSVLIQKVFIAWLKHLSRKIVGTGVGKND